MDKIYDLGAMIIYGLIIIAPVMLGFKYKYPWIGILVMMILLVAIRVKITL